MNEIYAWCNCVLKIWLSYITIMKVLEKHFILLCVLSSKKVATIIDLRSIFPCKKPRRSQRLESKESLVMESHNAIHGPLGYFEVMPLEVKFLLFSFMSREFHRILSWSSFSWNNLSMSVTYHQGHIARHGELLLYSNAFEWVQIWMAGF